MRGKVNLSILSAAATQDHPRLCGEKALHLAGIVLAAGSPPPMRGKGSILLNPVYCGGITPAYAGKRALANAATNSTRDHPRLCGEKTLSAIPHMQSTRITPAYAGKRQL